MIETISMERRLFLGASLSGLLTLSPSGVAKTQTQAQERSLSLYNQHTGETLYSVFWYQGSYQRDSLKEIEHLCRDHRSNTTHPVDTRLLELLYLLTVKLQNAKPIEIISAYRSQKTNHALRKRSRGVAKNSYHTRGQAVDIKVPNCSSQRLYRTAKALQAGGVGYYPRSGFIHIDTGPVRHW